MTADFSNTLGKGAGKRPVDSALEIAKWPEWGVEKWEETDRQPSPGSTSSPSLSLVSEPQQKLEEGSGINQGDPAGSQSESESQPKAPGNIRPRNNISRIAPGIATGLLFLGSVVFFAGRDSETASSDVPVPSPSRASVDLAPPELMVPAKAAGPTDPGGSANGTNAAPPLRLDPTAFPKAPEAPKAPVNEAVKAPLSVTAMEAAPLQPSSGAEQRPRTLARHARAVLPPMHVSAGRAPPDRVSARAAGPAHVCIRVYPELGRCHSQPPTP